MNPLYPRSHFTTPGPQNATGRNQQIHGMTELHSALPVRMFHEPINDGINVCRVFTRDHEAAHLSVSDRL